MHVSPQVAVALAMSSASQSVSGPKKGIGAALYALCRRLDQGMLLNGAAMMFVK